MGSEMCIRDSKKRNEAGEPGEILSDELEEQSLSASALAKALDIPANRITAILNS